MKTGTHQPRLDRHRFGIGIPLAFHTCFDQAGKEKGRKTYRVPASGYSGTLEELTDAVVYRAPIAVFEKIIEAGAGVDDTDILDRSALWWAISEKHLDAIYELVRLGADIEARHGFKSDSMLQSAVTFGDVHTVKALCDLGADINGTNSRDENALHTAVHEGKLTSALFLVSGGIDLHQVGDCISGRCTPLELAIKKKQIAIAKAVEDALAEKGELPIIDAAEIAQIKARARQLAELGFEPISFLLTPDSTSSWFYPKPKSKPFDLD